MNKCSKVVGGVLPLIRMWNGAQDHHSHGNNEKKKTVFYKAIIKQWMNAGGGKKALMS